MSDQRDQLTEIADRTRRMETRLTKFLMTMGFDTETHKPIWRNGVVHLPSMSASIKSCLEAIPEGWPPTRPVAISHAGDVKFTLLLRPDPA